MLVSFALWTALGLRGPALSDQARLAVRHAFWIFPAIVLGIVWIPVCLTAGLTRLRSMSSLSRGELCALAGAGAGVIFSFTCFPLVRG